MQIRVGRTRLLRRLSAVAAGLLLVTLFAGSASANVGKVTVSSQSPNPVVAGNTATFTVTANNTNLFPHGFAVTAVSGATGLSVAASGCSTVWGLLPGTLDDVQIATTSATPVGDITVKLTVTEYWNWFSCGGGTLDTKVITTTLHVIGVQSVSFDALAGHVYGDGPIALGATASSGLTVEFLAGGQCKVVGSTLTITGIGSCTVTASQAGNANWAPAADVTQSFKITPASLTITADNRHKTYGDAFALGDTAFTTSGLVAGDSVATVTLTSAGAASGASVGNYEIAPSIATGVGLANYTIAYTSGTLSVSKPILTVTAPSDSKILGADNPALDPTYSGFVNGDGASALATQPTCTTTAVASSPVGTYPITCSGGASDSYDFSYVAGTLSVALGSLDHIVVSPNPKTIVAGTMQAYTVEAFDAYSNSLGDVTASSTFTIDGTGSSCAVDNCGSTVVGDYTVKGTYRGEWTSTAILHVTAVPPTPTPPPSATADPTQIVEGATATPVRAATPPVTSSTGSAPGNSSLPLLLFLIALGFGGLGVLVAQAQRNMIRR